jgi:thymidylate kinase
VLVTREPGGTPFGEKLREVVLHHHTTPFAEALAMFADRSAHVEATLEPALKAGSWVLCDRFSDSTYAYQCGGHGLDPQRIVALEGWSIPSCSQMPRSSSTSIRRRYERQRAQSREPGQVRAREGRSSSCACASRTSSARGSMPIAST